MPKGVQSKTIANFFSKILTKKGSKKTEKTSTVLKKKKLRLTTIYGAVILLILVPIIYLTLQKGTEAAAWWNETWQYRVGYNISGSADTNKKILIEIDTAALISAGKMQSDCGDSRFTNNGGGVLKYYLDSTGGACNTSSTDYYVLVDTFYSTGTILYHYYGNPNAENGTEANNFSEDTYSPSGTSDNPEEIGKGPISYFKLDEGQGSSAYDTMGRNHASLGASTAAPQWKPESECISGKCLFFDNSNDYVQAADNDTMDILDEVDLTLTAWVKIPALSDNNMVMAKKLGTAANQPGYSMHVNSSGQVATYISDGVDQVNKFSSTTITANTWYHLAAVFDESSSLTIYINGANAGGSLNGTIANVGSLANSVPFRIGTDSDGDLPFSGYIDEVKIYRYARTVAELKSDYTSGSTSQGASATTVAQNEGGDLSNGLVGYWKMDEASWNGTSGEVKDTSGNSNNGTRVGNATTASGKFGNGGTFDGNGDYVNLGDQALHDLSFPFALSAWINMSALPSVKGSPAEIISKYGGFGGTRQWTLSIGDDNTLYFWKSHNGTSGEYGVVSGHTFTSGDLNVWRHVVYTVDANGTATLFVDGDLKETYTFSNTTVYSGASVNTYIGARATPWNYFQGGIDEARIYNRSISPSEVTQLYNFAPGPLAHWKFDESSGTSVVDSSGNGNNGTLTNGPTWTHGKLGSALSFDGTDDLVEIADLGNLAPIRYITVSAWVKFDQLTGTKGESQRIVRKVCSGAACGGFSSYILELDSTNTDSFRFGIHTGGAGGGLKFARTATNFATTNTWYHVTGVYNASGVWVYINGVNQTAAQPTNPAADIDSDSSDLRIGGHSINLSRTDGLIDDVRVYNYARTVSQILQDMDVSHSNASFPRNLEVLNLKLDEGSGLTALDSSSYGNNGTISGATWTAGVYGSALSFDGTNDLITIPDNNSLDLVDQVTISFWAKLNPIVSSSIEGIISKADLDSSYADDAFNVMRGDEDFRFHIDNNSAVVLNIADDSIWTHITYTWDGSTVHGYVNGVHVKEQAVSGTFLSTADPVRVGVGYANNNTRYLNGTLDEVKIYPYRLTHEQVYSDFNQNHSELFSMGALSTASDGITASNLASRAVCVPGDTSTCNGPVGEWNFDEASGTSARDTSGNGGNGTLGSTTAAPQWIPGKYGNALHFDGSDNLSIPDSNFYTGSTLSWEFWMKADTGNTGAAHIINKYNTTSNQRSWTIVYNAGSSIGIVLSSNGSSNAQSATTFLPSENAWHHIAITYNAGTVSFYIDGVLNSTQANSQTTTFNNNTAITVGQNAPSGGNFIGSLDQIRIYNYVRTPAQVAWSYNRGAPVAHYKFDECQGTTINDWAPNADGGFNGNNGTLTVGGSGDTTFVGTCASAGGAWSKSGKNNSSIRFDGTDDYVYVSSVALPTLDFTYTAWIYLDSNTDERILMASDGSTANEVSLDIGSGGNLIVIVNGTSADLTTNTVFSTGRWYHVAVTRSGGVLKAYIDGVQDSATGSDSATLNFNSCGLLIGVDADAGCTGSLGNYYDGRIDDVKVYNYALTHKQIQTDMSGGTVSFR